MAQILTSLSGLQFSAASAAFAPTNSADVSAIASAYQVVSATATQLYAGTAYVTSVNDAPLSAARAGNATNAVQATSAWYDGTGRLLSSLPDEATVSSIASAYAAPKLDTSALERWQTGDEPLAAYSGIGGIPIHPTGADYAHEADYADEAESASSAEYAESADYWTNASSKQDTLTFGYDAEDKISSINGSSLAGEGGGLVTALGTGTDPWYQNSVSSINGMNLSAKWADSASTAAAANTATSATYAQTADYAKTIAPSAVSAYISAVTSQSGTIIVTNRTGIDATDSAVVGEYVPGYSGISTYANTLVPFNGFRSAIFTGIPDSLPVTASLAMKYGAPDTITFSGSNGTTASASYNGSPIALTADLGKVSSVYVYTQNEYIEQDGLTYTADAVDNASIVALAHASALPTYQYDAEDKISSINGSAIAGGAGGGIDSATCSAIASAYAESAASSKLDSSASSSFYGIDNPSGFLTTAYTPTFGYNTADQISSIDGSALGGMDEAAVSAIASAYAESAASGKLDASESSNYYPASNPSGFISSVDLSNYATTAYVDSSISGFAYNSAVSGWTAKQDALTFGYDTADKISSINGSSLAGEGGGGLVTAIGTSESGITSINNSGLVDTAALRSADYSSLYVQEPLYISASGDSSYIGISGDVGGVDSATCSAIASAYAESAVSAASSNYYTTANESGFLTAQVQASWSESASASPSYIQDKPDLVDIVAGPGIVVDNPDGNTLRVSVAVNERVTLWEATALTDHITSCNLSETLTNFEQIEVMFQTNNDNRFFCTYPSDPKFMPVETVVVGNNNTVFHKYASFSITNDSKTLTRQYCCEHSNANTPAASDVIWLYKIVGIHRIANN